MYVFYDEKVKISVFHNRMRSNCKYFSRIEKNRTPDRTHRVTSNYYRFKNTLDRSSFKTTVYSNNNYLRRDEIYPRTPNYVQSHKRKSK